MPTIMLSRIRTGNYIACEDWNQYPDNPIILKGTKGLFALRLRDLPQLFKERENYQGITGLNIMSTAGFLNYSEITNPNIHCGFLTERGGLHPKHHICSKVWVLENMTRIIIPFQYHPLGGIRMKGDTILFLKEKDMGKWLIIRLKPDGSQIEIPLFTNGDELLDVQQGEDSITLSIQKGHWVDAFHIRLYGNIRVIHLASIPIKDDRRRYEQDWCDKSGDELEISKALGKFQNFHIYGSEFTILISECPLSELNRQDVQDAIREFSDKNEPIRFAPVSRTLPEILYSS